MLKEAWSPNQLSEGAISVCSSLPEIAPVICVLAFGDQAKGEAAAQRAGHIDAAAAAANTVGGAADAGVPVILRFLLIRLMTPPGLRMPYSSEAEPFRTSTRSVVASMLNPGCCARRR